MPQLKPSFVAELKDALRNSIFTLEDFELAFPDSGAVLFRIAFIHHPDYVLECKESIKRETYTVKHQILMDSREKKRSYRMVELSLAPGQYKSKDTMEVDDFGQTTSIIPEWCRYIRDDLHALAPKPGPLAELRVK